MQRGWRTLITGARTVWRQKTGARKKWNLRFSRMGQRRYHCDMRFTTQILLGLAVIFTTLIAVEGLPQGSSPSPSPRVSESPTKPQQTTRKKGFWPWSRTAKTTPTASPVVEVGKTKKQKKQETVDIPAEGPTAVPKPRRPRDTTVNPTPYPVIGVPESATPAPGGGPGMVWVNTKTHVYHSEKSRWYGTTKEGKYMTEEEAKADGNRPARVNE